MADTKYHVREPSIVDFSAVAPKTADGLDVWIGRGQNFLVEWARAKVADAVFVGESVHEVMLLLPENGAELTSSGETIAAPGRSICIIPAGAFKVRLPASGLCISLSTDLRSASSDGVINAAAYSGAPDGRIEPIGPPFKAVAEARIKVIEIDKISAPADKPRLKMIQSATMSINWVEYSGARTRTELSPHSHDTFEQGSLAIVGDFMHHLRVPWGPDASLWRDDRHVRAPERSLSVFPVGLIHTTEGIGDGRHLLIDIFAPARHDFLARGWIANASDYNKQQGEERQ